ncbi:MAG: YihA family ribosome biogenesis GTP-binding protein [Clostridiaceae bacterium]|jgi:GTP-binding protein|nr:YihA family ribosome biogenesis GTP-binding protein [Clostridiaceae bacterium]
MNTKLLISAVAPSQYPKNNLNDIAFVGRSNVGKSSLINKLTARKALARTSSTPGKTATINFYQVNDKVNLVDLPGYGYAKVSKAEKAKWGEIIETYLSLREELVLIIMLVDIRHNPTENDLTMADWIKGNGFTPVVVATKADKISKTQAQDSVLNIKKMLDVEMVIPFSAKSGDGTKEVWAAIDKGIRG